MSTQVLRRIEDFLKSDQEENVLIGFALLNANDADIRLKLTVLHRCNFGKAPVTEDGKPVRGKYIGFNIKNKRYYYENNEFSDYSMYSLPMGLYQQVQMKSVPTYDMKSFKVQDIENVIGKLFNDK